MDANALKNILTGGYKMSGRERLIGIMQALEEQSSPAHPLSAPKLCAILAGRGIEADRRSVYADISALESMGWGVAKTTRGYYSSGRPLAAEHARLAMQAVDCAPFIDESTAGSIKQGLAAGQDKHFEAPCQIERARGGEDRLLRALNAICACIAAKKQLSYCARDDSANAWPRERVEPIKLIYAGGELILHAAKDGHAEYIPLANMRDIRPEINVVKRP